MPGSELLRAVDVQVSPLEGVDLEAAPPCEMKVGWRRFGLFGRWMRPRQCGRPSVCRVKAVCPEHGVQLRFLCSWHLRVLKLGAVACWSCDSRSPVRFAGDS
jgi:hypothetical protein